MPHPPGQPDGLAGSMRPWVRALRAAIAIPLLADTVLVGMRHPGWLNGLGNRGFVHETGRPALAGADLGRH